MEISNRNTIFNSSVYYGILFIILFCTAKVTAQQSDAINAYNSKGEKQGFWVYRGIARGKPLMMHMTAPDIYMGWYDKGIKMATWRLYNASGFLEYTETYNNENSDSMFYRRVYLNNKVIAEGMILDTYTDSTVVVENPITGKIEEKHEKWLNELKTGEWKYYKKNGKLKRKEYYPPMQATLND